MLGQWSIGRDGRSSHQYQFSGASSSSYCLGGDSAASLAVIASSLACRARPSYKCHAQCVPRNRGSRQMSSHRPARRSAFKHRCEGIPLGVQSSHLSAFLFGWHWDIGDVYIHSSGLVPSMQLCCAIYHVFESCRNVDHFVAVAFCKASASFSSRSIQNPAL